MSEPLTDKFVLEGFLQTHPMCALYFTTPDCAVCKVLKPKLIDMLAEHFPEIAFAEVNCELSPALAAGHSVFTVPTLIVFTLGKESQRKSRSFGLGALALELERPYSLLFGER